MKYYRVLVEPWSVYVKEESYFNEQGGRTQPWGKRWERVRASSIESARNKGGKLQRERYGKEAGAR